MQAFVCSPLFSVSQQFRPPLRPSRTHLRVPQLPRAPSKRPLRSPSRPSSAPPTFSIPSSRSPRSYTHFSTRCRRAPTSTITSPGPSTPRATFSTPSTPTSASTAPPSVPRLRPAKTINSKPVRRSLIPFSTAASSMRGPCADGPGRRSPATTISSTPSDSSTPHFPAATATCSLNSPAATPMATSNISN